ncbi:hypothetical protein [Sphingosinicella sp. BN140058]|uniref:hypothetical protein n=1 Tax=Sphingosinicella sp. BN140058 TaxID=1892855 RepID=UPI0010136738|nr:hypothetical protein [Sphingosinicella sp. BN140058]QAY76860.1 hypothetical protein ETR14_10390 [Sphingosinicella sp. BN140058]
MRSWPNTLATWLLAAVMLAGCVTRSPSGDGLDEIAKDYVQLQLEIGEREPGYIDAYYGPAEWQAAAKSAPRSLAELAIAADDLSRRAEAIDDGRLERMEQRRRAFLVAQLKAAATRLRMLRGEKLAFADEAEGLFGVRPALKPLAAYDPILGKIEALVPGSGTLAERVDAFQDRFVIPKDRLEPVFRAAIAECRRRTLAHIKVPAEEKFTLEFVTGKSWGGYNWYQGGATSLIQVNTDLPIRISRAIDLGCHEGYPGHHVYNMLLERELARARGWVEYTIYPLYSPQSLLAEGSANYGIDLAFPGKDAVAFETSRLYPLAGLPAAEADHHHALLEAMRDLAGARFTIAAEFLEGRIDREAAIALIQKYQLVSRPRAEQSLAFTEQYRSYVINYGLGQDLVRAHVEAAGPGAEERWAAMARILSEPTLPSDLVAD